MSSSLDGMGTLERENLVCVREGPRGAPGIRGSQRQAGTMDGPGWYVRRLLTSVPMLMSQDEAACARCAAVYSTWASFSASEIVSGVIAATGPGEGPLGTGAGTAAPASGAASDVRRTTAAPASRAVLAMNLRLEVRLIPAPVLEKAAAL